MDAIQNGVKALASKCETTGCEAAAVKRIQLPLLKHFNGQRLLDLCIPCAIDVQGAIRGTTLAIEQCPGCLAIAPKVKRESARELVLECQHCAGEYGKVEKLSSVIRETAATPACERGGTFYFDLITPTGRSHGWACTHCRRVVQWG